jgi:hypothetical protein
MRLLRVIEIWVETAAEAKFFGVDVAGAEWARTDAIAEAIWAEPTMEL